MTRFPLLVCLCATAAITVLAQGNGTNTTEDGLHALAVRAGKLFFGTATETGNLDDAAYMRVVNNSREFGLLVPENSQKWESTQPRQGQFTFGNADRLVSLADANEQFFRCHTLTWFQQLPSFVQTTNWTKETLTAAIETHISNVVGHYKSRCLAWDVVNEAVNENGTFRNSVFFRTLGEEFIDVSFKAAARADPAAALYYNDFNIEFPGNKSEAALRIVRRLKQTGVHIDGVGFQGHFTVGRTPTRVQLAAHLNRFVKLGVEVSFTELDVRHASLPPSAQAVQQQARDYVAVVGACLDVPACMGVVLWQPSDKYSWIPATFPGEGEACLFDANMTRKPAYESVKSLLSIAAASAAAVRNNASAVPVSTPRPTPTAGLGVPPSASANGSAVAVASGAGVVPPVVAGEGGAGRRSALDGVLFFTLAAGIFGIMML